MVKISVLTDQTKERRNCKGTLTLSTILPGYALSDMTKRYFLPIVGEGFETEERVAMGW